MDVRTKRMEKAGGGVGGQRLKSHHKSYPERKCEVVPPRPPLSPRLPPLRPLLRSPATLLLFHGSIASLLFHTECPMDGPGVFYITPSCTSNNQTPAHFYPGACAAFNLPPFPPPPSSLSPSPATTGLLQIYKSPT